MPSSTTIEFPAKTIRWLPDSAEQRCAPSRIFKVILGAYAPVQLPSTGSANEKQQTNEWVAYLTTSDSNAVRVELVPYGIGVKRALILFQHEFDLIDPVAIKKVHISLGRSLKVSEVIHLIREAGYDRYMSPQHGSGCRWWLHELITLLQQRGYFNDHEQFEETTRALGQVWQSQDKLVLSDRQTDLEANAGSFFNLEALHTGLINPTAFEHERDSGSVTQPESNNCALKA